MALIQDVSSFSSPVSSAEVSIPDGSTTMELQGLAVSTVTGIPASVKRIHIALYEQSWTAVSVGTIIQIGTSSGIKATGYESLCTQILSTTVSRRQSTIGFNFKSLASAERVNGEMTLVRTGAGSNTWVASHMFAYYDGSGTTFGGGQVTLGGELTQISLKPESTGGTNDSNGTMTVTWSF